MNKEQADKLDEAIRKEFTNTNNKVNYFCLPVDYGMMPTDPITEESFDKSMQKLRDRIEEHSARRTGKSLAMDLLRKAVKNNGK